MPLIKRVAAAFLFESGVIAVTDAHGQQIPELQGSYSIEKHKRILLEALPDCELNGFEILPTTFISKATAWANWFRNQNMSYEDIKNI